MDHTVKEHYLTVIQKSSYIMNTNFTENRLMNTRSKQFAREFVILATTFIFLAICVFSYIKNQNAFESWQENIVSSTIGQVFFIATSILFVIKLAYFVFNLTLYIIYKPIKTVNQSDLPKCTVIIPAYNEGELVYHTLHSVANSLYPKEKLEIITIDDGSKDDTWEWMQKAAQEIGESVTLYKQPTNKGKREGLYYGFSRAKGDVVVTIDSDSIIKNDTLAQLVSPFVTNKNCGAVAGNVKILNDKTALIPKMLNVSFAFSFEFIRSAQSTLGSVFCTPGALAAYKKTSVLKVLDAWMNQTFMGKKSDIGEDRALTNMILKEGEEVLFQKNAIVYTNIPEHYTNLYKMYIRWERSNIRESIMMSKFAFTNFRRGSKIGTRIILIDQLLTFILAYPLLIAMIAILIVNPLFSLISTGIGILLFSSIQMLFFAKKHSVYGSLWAYPYSLFYAFALFWITPYSIATAGKSGWLTRDLK